MLEQRATILMICNMRMHSFFAAGTLVFSLTAAPISAFANDAATLAAMQAQLQALSQQVQALNAKVEAQNTTIAAQQAEIAAQKSSPIIAATPPVGATTAQAWDAQAVASAPPVVSGSKTPVKVTMGQRLKIESADGLYSFEPYGRAHVDAVMFKDDLLDRGNNAAIRRARLGFRGRLGEDFAYRMEMDFGNEDTNIRDAYLTYSGLEFADVHVGNMKPALGFEQLTSSNDLMMVERAAVSNAFTRGHILGATVTSGGDNWSLRTGVYNEDARVNNGDDDEAVSIDARLTTDLLRDSDSVLHLGATGSWRKPNSVANSLTFATAPAGAGPLSIVSTGAIADVDNALVYGAELGAVFGPWSLQSEYMIADVTRSGAPSARFDGWYAQTGWLLTGESRPYEGSSGVFGRVKPKNPLSIKNGDWGAFEILARYDTLSLNDAGAGILGGSVDQYGLGLNWYLLDNVRMMLNYTSVNSDATAVVPDDSPDVYHLRAQWDF